MLQIPVNATSCMSGRLPYCVYAIEPQVAAGRQTSARELGGNPGSRKDQSRCPAGDSRYQKAICNKRRHYHDGDSGNCEKYPGPPMGMYPRLADRQCDVEGKRKVRQARKWRQHPRGPKQKR